MGDSLTLADAAAAGSTPLQRHQLCGHGFTVSVVPQRATRSRLNVTVTDAAGKTQLQRQLDLPASHAMHLEESPTTGDEVITNYTINFAPAPCARRAADGMELDGDHRACRSARRAAPPRHRKADRAQDLPGAAYFDRLDYCSPLAQEYSYVLAIEKLLNVEVPERAQYLRVLFAELTRICNHMLNIGAHVMDVGAMTPNLWVFELREDCMNFFERASGARMHSAWFRPGGVHQDVPEKLLVDIGNWVDGRLQELFGDAMSLVLDNRIFKQRNVDIAVVSQDDAVAWGFSGPMIRAAGIPWDLRKSQPYDVYERMEFDIPVGTNSDCYDRFVVRVKEVSECAKIIMQCLAQMPSGPICSTTRSRRPSAPR